MKICATQQLTPSDHRFFFPPPPVAAVVALVVVVVARRCGGDVFIGLSKKEVPAAAADPP